MGVVGGWFQLCVFQQLFMTSQIRFSLTVISRSPPIPLWHVKASLNRFFVVLLLPLKMLVLSLDSLALLDSNQKGVVPRDRNPEKQIKHNHNMLLQTNPSETDLQDFTHWF